jgi:hypothetical protein
MIGSSTFFGIEGGTLGDNYWIELYHPQEIPEYQTVDHRQTS